MDGTTEAGFDVDDLELQLKALSFSNRLKLLSVLQTPRTVDEIHLTPAKTEGAGEPGGKGRPLSREAVRHHLEQMVDAGLVSAELVQQADGRTRKQYVLDESRLYEVAETLRSLSTREGESSRSNLRQTETGNRSAQPEWPAPPRLLLVHGAPGQRAFPLREDTIEPPRGWVIGRDPGADVTLEYDPFVSGQNTEIVPTEDGGYEVLNLRTARNGTVINQTMLEGSQTHPLEHGDILRVGSSNLVFHTS